MGHRPLSMRTLSCMGEGAVGLFPHQGHPALLQPQLSPRAPREDNLTLGSNSNAKTNSRNLATPYRFLLRRKHACAHTPSPPPRAGISLTPDQPNWQLRLNPHTDS